MSLHIEPLSSLPQLRGLLEVTRLVRDERDLTRLVDGVAATISESLGWSTVAINLYRPAEGRLRSDDGARERRGARRLARHDAAGRCVDAPPRRALPPTRRLLDSARRGRLGGSALAYPGSFDQLGSQRLASGGRSVVPMRGADGTLLGVVSVDEPESGLRPSRRGARRARRLRRACDRGIRGRPGRCRGRARPRIARAGCSTSPPRWSTSTTADAVLETVARGIQEALEFDKVAVCLAHGGAFSPSGTAGWEPDDPGLDFGLTDADLDLLLVPEFEIEGCYLIEDTVATALVGDCSTYVSARRRRGPRAWSNHWLLVPLIERDGSRSGFIWADDPSDSMLPSRERLQALRTFANQATMALRAARDFETLNARNSELGRTARRRLSACSSGLDLDSVLTRDHAQRLFARRHPARVSRARRRRRRGAFDGREARLARGCRP